MRSTRNTTTFSRTYFAPKRWIGLLAFLFFVVVARNAYADCTTGPAVAPAPVLASETVWIEDEIPAGANLYGPTYWDSSQKASGSQSLSRVAGAGENVFGVANATATMPIAWGENLVFYILVNDCAQPRKLVAQWAAADGTWGGLTWGETTGGHVYMGPVPAAGVWTRIEIPARQLNLETKAINTFVVYAYDGQAWVDRIGKSGQGCLVDAVPPPSFGSETVWMDDSVPAGATAYGTTQWTSDQKASGSQSITRPAGPGENVIGFGNATDGLAVTWGESLVFYVLTNECVPPEKIIAQWQATDGTWGGAAWGVPTNGHVYMGPLPEPGVWTRVEIPASQLLLENKVINGFYLYFYGGQAWLDRVGKSGTGCYVATAPPPLSFDSETVWADDAIPAGATAYGSPQWDAMQKASGSQSMTRPPKSGESAFGFANAADPMAVGVGESLIFYALPNECAPPTKIVAQWVSTNGSWGGASWGQSQSGHAYMGPLPASGTWGRLEVPASSLNLEGLSIETFVVYVFNGQAWIDRIGKTGEGCFPATAPAPELGTESVWVDDALPAGASLYSTRWDSTQKASGSQSMTRSAQPGISYLGFTNATATMHVESGDNLVFYALTNECVPTQKIAAQWSATDGTSAGASWGLPSTGYVSMGPMPPLGQWSRFEVPSALLNLAGKDIAHVIFTIQDGQVWFDRIGTANVPPAVISIALAPAMLSLSHNAEAQLTASASYDDGTSIDVTTDASWSSGAAEIATVSQSGLVSGASPGTTTISATFNGHQATATVTVTAVTSSLTITPGASNLSAGATQQLTVEAALSDGSIADVTTRAIWASSQSTVASVSPGGEVTAISPGTAVITATVDGVSTTALVQVSGPTEQLPPDPVTVAPTINSTVIGTAYELTRFLYDGPSPIQTGVAADAIERLRAAVIRGRVLQRGGTPLSGVRITLLGHTEYGRTLTRTDGRFDCAVNGGGPLTVQYRKEGYISIDRQLTPAGSDYGVVDDVVMIPLDAAVTSIDLNTAGVKVARGSTSVDSSGSRRATLLFPPNASATMTLPNGSTQAINQLSVRATEYTVGSDGPASMPAALPPQSGYTYCVELSADEAMAAGASRIDFSNPVAFYLDNFLGFPAGSEIPVGYYDRTRGVWVPAANGRVVRIAEIVEGRAYLDVDGDYLIDDSDALIGTTIAEREKLATLYSTGRVLWRATMTHFTPVDLNWSVSLPPDASQPDGKPTYYAPCSPCTESGSIIEAENQTLGEALPVTGTPFALSYRSDRTYGRVASRTLDIPLSGTTLPASLLRIDLEISIAGTLTRRSFPATPNQSFRFVWDGRDAYGRALEGGGAPVTINTIYVYPGEFQNARSANAFGLASGERSGIPARFEMTTSSRWLGHLGGRMSLSERIGGWTLSPHHFYDAATKTLYRGDGSRKSDLPLRFGSPTGVMSTVVGTGTFNSTWPGVGGPAKNAAIDKIEGMAVAPDGALYLASQDFIHKVTPDGILHRVAGKLPSRKPTTNELQTAQPAVNAQIWRPHGFSAGPDGSLYIAEPWLGTVRRITPDGDIVPFAGTGTNCTVCVDDGIPATSARLDFPQAVAAAPDGSVYITETDKYRIRRVGPDGMITTVAGSGTRGYSGDSGPAFAAMLSFPESIALGPDGSLYFGDLNRIRRVTPDGLITTVAGNGQSGTTGDGGLATASSINLSTGGPTFLSVAADGSIFFADGNRLRKIDTAGILSTVAGTGVQGIGKDGEAATATNLNGVDTVAVAPDGTLYFTEGLVWKVHAIRSTLPALTADAGEITIADGSLLYVFNQGGRHLRTLLADTGAVLYEFGYAAGLLVTITDHDGNVTSIERDSSSGNAIAIAAPGGQQTQIGAGLYASSITTAPGEVTHFDYTANGLMTGMTDPRNNETEFLWNDLGLLASDEDPEDGAKGLARTARADGHAVTITTAEGRSRSYSSEVLSSGESRRQNIDAAGLTTATVQRIDGTATTTSADGSTLTTRTKADPVLGMQSPFTSSMTLTLPSGKSATSTVERLATSTQPGNPLSVATRTDRFTIGGKTFTSTFNRSNLTETFTTPMGRVLKQTMDDVGRIRLVTLPVSLAAISFDYDSQGRMVTTAQGTRQQTFGYNSRNELTSVTDALQRTTQFNYDDAGRVTRQILPDEREIGFLYDTAGNLTSVTPPGRPAHGFDFTKVNLASRYTPPSSTNGGVTQYFYNKDRQLVGVQQPGGATIAIGHDVAGRVQSLTWPNGALTYGYYGTGALASIEGADASLTYAWDGSYPTSMTWSGGISGSVDWTYDDQLRLASETVVGSTTPFTYNDDSQLKTAGALKFFYAANTGQLEVVDLGDSVLYPGDAATEDWRTYNEYGEVMEYGTWYGGSVKRVYQYQRDDIGRIAAVTETEGASTTQTDYAYDDAGRLKDVTSPRGNVHYDYDANGNRAQRQVTFDGATSTETATYETQDRLLSYAGAQYTYTPNGELLTKTDSTGTTTYSYDALSNLRHVALPNGKQIDYLIDGQNRRVGKKIDGVMVRQWLYADQLRIVAELDGDGNTISRFVYASRSNVPDYMLRDGKMYRIFSDHLGSPRTIVETLTEAVIATMEYDEFGNVLSDSYPGFEPFGFAGGLDDRDTGLVRFGARDYDPSTGRWTTKEPLGFGGGDPNLYVYVGNNPINWVDPSGLVKIRDMECADLRREINRLTNELAERAAEEKGIQDDLLSGRLSRPNIVNFIKYANHKDQFGQKQRRVKKLLKEFDRRPCNPDITSAVREWSSREYPDDDYLWHLWRVSLKELLLEGPGKPAGAGPVLFPAVGPVPIPIPVW